MTLDAPAPIDITLTQDDWLHFSALAAKRGSAGLRFSRPLSLALTAALGIVFALGPWLVGQALGRRADPEAFFAGLVFGVLAIALVARFNVRAQKANMRNWVRPDGYILKPRMLTLDARGVRSSNAHGTALVPWREVDDITRDGDLAVIWLDVAAGHMVPARAFPSESAFEAFLAYARQEIDRAKGSTASG